MAIRKFETLCDDACTQAIYIEMYALPERMRGLYFENEFCKCITLNKSIDTYAEKLCVLAEELGHSIFGGGILIDNPTRPNIRKHERRARVWAYKKLLPAKQLIAALKSSYYSCNFEVAQDFDVTEDFLLEAVEYYKSVGMIPSYNNKSDCEFGDW